MRQLQLTLPADRVAELDELVEANDGQAYRTWPAPHHQDSGRQQYAEVVVTNRRVGDFLDAVEGLGATAVTMAPRSVLALDPGRDQAPDDLVDVEPLSPQEVYLAGLQSVGSWTGFLGYAAVAGAIVWNGMLVGSTFLLIAAMLIAPFAGPAMNAALATATGDLHLFRRAVLRYAASIALLIAVVAALHAMLGTDIATALMTETANVSAVTVLLPLTAGAAGALNLMQSERSSLVSGAATGVLVAAALAPPAGLVGMAAVIGEWSMVGSGAFLLVLQLVGLNLSGAVVFRLWGMRPGRARYGRGRAAASWGVMAASSVVVVGLVAYQQSDPLTLRRSSVQHEIEAHLSGLVDEDPDAGLVEVDARFTRPDIPGQATVLGLVHVQSLGGADPDDLEQRLGRALSWSVSDRFDVVGLVAVTAIPPP